MTYNNDTEQRSQILAMLFGAFGKADDANRIVIYAKMLEEMPVTLLSKAAKRLILEKQFLPSIAEIIAAAKSIAAEVQGTEARLPDWQEAWAEIDAAARSSEKPIFSHPLIALAVKTYGLNNLRYCDSSNYSTAHAQVRRIYDNLCKRYTDKSINTFVIGDSRGEIAAALKNAGAGLVKIGNVKALPEAGR
ncbi:MAG: hypothetical protein DBY32_03950 [Phascolarctobacterium sp.]|nr:MAG: hypothetical protein DBY32_03950 [Phascolarctobacterium sp.]